MNEKQSDYLTHELNYSKNCVACESHEAVLKKRIKELIEKEISDTFSGKLKQCFDAEFHGVDCMECGDEYGFEGCYRGDINHPDPRPAHQIWLKKIDAEKLFMMFLKSPELTFLTDSKKRGGK